MTGAGPLEGVRVLDFTMYVAGPYCTRLLADMGAEVIKVEPPGGEVMRKAPPFRDGVSAYFGHLNCGKKSIELDLKSAMNIATVRALATRVDVVVENYRPGVMARLGLAWERLRELKPDLVYCSISGYGQTGPDAGKPAFATIINAASGFDMMMMDYEPALDRPLRHRSNAPDFMGGVHGCAAIAAALFGRDRTGRGQRIDVAMMDTIHNMMAHEYQAAQLPDAGQAPVFAPVRARDGFLMVAPISAANFAALARALDRGTWLDDARFATAPARIDNWDVLLGEIDAVTRTRPADELDRRINAEGCPCTRYLTLADSLSSRQVRARGAAVSVSDGSAVYQVANTPMLFENAAVSARPWVARTGQHTGELLAELESATGCGGSP
ncbi:MAG: CoA transferase [Alphaproteobacteria bacterium]|nr:CoA transferase [Alphaproteobacteria bacterium]